MYKLIISIPADNHEEKWQEIAACEHIDFMDAIVKSLMNPNVDGPLVIRIEKRRVIQDGK